MLDDQDQTQNLLNIAIATIKFISTILMMPACELARNVKKEMLECTDRMSNHKCSVNGRKRIRWTFSCFSERPTEDAPVDEPSAFLPYIPSI